ncbi:MAG: phosphotransferase [Pseudomonadales bacterium]|nr:phosphotransferase [Pseudomonadales bacterium]NRA17732.1 phosphotransferase [Oceanospirillaceae bacterium]
MSQKVLSVLDGFESFIYQFSRGSVQYILRVAHTDRRSQQMIAAQIAWINVLAAGGTRVATAVHSKNAHLVERIDDGVGGFFLATAFVKVLGHSSSQLNGTPQLYQNYGSLLGKIQALSKRYHPVNNHQPRPHWDDRDFITQVKDHVPQSQLLIVTKYVQQVLYQQQLHKCADSYGLIHNDAHAGNRLIDAGGEINLFDFDDCCYSWFIDDIAIVLLYMSIGEDDKSAFYYQFSDHFMRGYNSENTLQGYWFKEIPHFLKLREIDLYSIIQRSFDVQDLQDSFVWGFMQDRQSSIENDVPYINFDLDQFAAEH